jgi:hypothetical protein
MLTLRSSDAARLEVVETALASIEIGINFKEANMLLGELKHLRERLGLPASRHDQAEITELSRAFRLGGDPVSYIGPLKRCAASSDASEFHRLAACRQLLMISEITVDAPLARFAYRAMEESTGTSHRHTLTALIFHTLFGASAEAKRLASLLYEQTHTDPTLLAYVLNAAYAEYRIGEWTVAESRLNRTLQLARQGNSRAGEMHGRLLLARLYYSVGQLGAARIWYNSFRELLSEISDEELVWEHNLLGARLCAREGHITAARNHLEAAKTSTFARLTLPKLTIGVCDLELRGLEGFEPGTAADLEDLLSLHMRSRGLGGQDDVVRGLCTALRYHGRESEALNLVTEYLTLYRRDGYPPDFGIDIQRRKS